MSEIFKGMTITELKAGIERRRKTRSIIDKMLFGDYKVPKGQSLEKMSDQRFKLSQEISAMQHLIDSARSAKYCARTV